MNNSDNEYDIKSIFVNYIILITLCIFVVIYIIINYDMIKLGNYYRGDITKSVLLTGIIILLLYLLTTWDDVINSNSDNNQEVKINQEINNIEIPKFSLADVNRLTNPISSHYKLVQTQIPSHIPSNPTNVNESLQFPNMQKDFGVSNGLDTMNAGESKYRINNIYAPIPNNSFGNSSIQVKYNNPVTNLTQVKRHIDKLENQNIFVSQKNSLRYGIKF